MTDNSKRSKRKLKERYSKTPTTVKHALEVRRLKAQIKELEERLDGGWVSPNGEWCDIIYAARYIGKRPQTLRNNRRDEVGPVSFGDGSGVRYRVSLLDRWLETKYSQRDYDEENLK